MAKKKTAWDKIKEVLSWLGSIAVIIWVVMAVPMYSETKRSNDITADQNKTVLNAELRNKRNQILVTSGEVGISIWVKNVGTEPLLSNEKELQWYDAYSSLKIIYLNDLWDVVGSENFDFEAKIEKIDSEKNVSLTVATVPVNTRTIQVALSCDAKNQEIKPCVPRSNVLTFSYLKKLEILGVDATKSDDRINLWVARWEIAQAFWIVQSESTYKTVPAGIEFPVTHKDSRENWGWIILLYNSQYSPDSEVVKTMIELLNRIYGYAPVIFKEYNLENFNFYTQRFSECKPEWWKNICVSKTMKFVDMKSGADPEWNLFSKTIFSENPDLDFMFILPYNNQK